MISRFKEILERNVPNDLTSLLRALEKASRPPREVNELYFLDCFFMEKKYSLKNITWTINRGFLHEYYLLVQITRMCQVFSQNILERRPDFQNITKVLVPMKNNVRESLPDLCKERKDSVSRFFAQTNENIIILIAMIGSPAFHEKLILLEEDDLNDLIKPKSIKNISPLKILSVFLLKIQVFFNNNILEIYR